MDTVEQSGNGTEPVPVAALVESLLFVADEPVTVERLAEALEVDVAAVEAVLAEMSANGAYRGVRLQRKGDRVQLVTRAEAAPYIERFMGLDTAGRLSQAALETLAIVAYRQPCTRTQIESVRGVNCDGVLSTLLAKGLIEVSGRLETVGHPIQYSTTFAFLQHFGLDSLEGLPPLESTQTPTLVEPDQGESSQEPEGRPSQQPESPPSQQLTGAPYTPAFPAEPPQATDTPPAAGSQPQDPHGDSSPPLPSGSE